MKKVPYIRGVPGASLEELKSFCASLATYGGVALFHMEGITPEVCRVSPHRGQHRDPARPTWTRPGRA